MLAYGPYWLIAPAIQWVKGLTLTERAHEASDRRLRLRMTDVWVLSVWQIKSFWASRQGGLWQHPKGDPDSRHRLDEIHLRLASIGPSGRLSPDV